MMATFDRTDALNRDDIHFFTPDHPLLRSALDFPPRQRKRQHRTLCLPRCRSTRHILAGYLHWWNASPPVSLHVDRYLPITPITLWLDHNGEITTAPNTSKTVLNQTPDSDQILGNSGIKRLIKKMVKSAERKMFELIQDIAEEAGIAVEQELQSEISRLQNLAQPQPRSRPN